MADMDAHRRMRWAVLGSLLAHALLVPLLLRGAISRTPSQRPRPVELTQLTPAQLAMALRNARGPLTKQTPAPKPMLAMPPTPEPPKPRGQVVSVAPTNDTRPPPDGRFVSEFNTRVDHETASRERGLYDHVLPKKSEGAKMPSGVASAAPRVEARPPAPPSAPHPARDPFDLQLNLFGDGRDRQAHREAQAPSAMAPKPDVAREGVPGTQGDAAPALGLGAGDRGPLAGGPAPDDLRGVEEGDATLLNSRAWRYAGFMNRVKETVARIWIPQVQREEQRRDPSGNIYAWKDRQTLVQVELDRTGKVSLVYVAEPSGVDFLDQLAVNAFREAERFPNPPNGLLEQDGHVRFAFGFDLTSSHGGTGLHIVGGPVPGDHSNSGFLPIAPRR